MCVVSMVMQQGIDTNPEWWKRGQQIITTPPNLVPTTLYPNVDFFNELLKKAKAYDEMTKQPDCENDEKKKALKKIADELGIEIKFV